MAHIETSGTNTYKSERHHLHQHQTPPSDSLSDYLFDRYQANTLRTENADLPDAFWAWRSEIDPYIDYGVVGDHLIDEVFSKVFRNIDEQDLNLTKAEKGDLKRFLNHRLQEFSGVVGLAMMAAASDVDAALVEFLKDLKFGNAGVQ